jgi:hypothetical protein
MMAAVPFDVQPTAPHLPDAGQQPQAETNKEPAGANQAFVARMHQSTKVCSSKQSLLNW